MHDLPAVDPDIELAPHYVDMRGGVPIGAGMRAIGITESDVDSGDLLVLQNIADHVVDPDVGADRELTERLLALAKTIDRSNSMLRAAGCLPPGW